MTYYVFSNNPLSLSPDKTAPTKQSDNQSLPVQPPQHLIPTPPNDPKLISPVTRVDYNLLRDLIATGKWKEADVETTRMILQAAGREKEGYLEYEDIDKFSCEDLRILDRLWLESSQEKFGFSVQKGIYHSSGGTKKPKIEVWNQFTDSVSWFNESGFKPYSELTFNLNAPKGQFPTFIRYNALHPNAGNGKIAFKRFMELVSKCDL